VKRVLILISALAVAAFFGLEADRSEGKVTFVTQPVSRGNLLTSTTSTGTIEAVVTVEVGTELSGQVAELLVDFNDEVKTDQVIARLDQRSFEARVREARAALAISEAGVRMQEAAVERARSGVARAETRRLVFAARTDNARIALAKADRDLERTGGLKQKGAVAASVFEDVQSERDTVAVDLRSAEAEQAVHEQEVAIAHADLLEEEARLANARGIVLQQQAALDLAEIELDRATIRSPIDGVIIGRNIDRGQTLTASLAPVLFKIAHDLGEMEVHAKIDEADIGRIQLGQRAVFSVDSFPHRSFDGTVVQIRKAPEIVRNVVVYTVLIATSNPDLLLLPGMTAVAQIITSKLDGVLKVPNAALRFTPPDGPEGAAGGEVPADEGLAGNPGTVWVLDADGRPSAVRIGTGTGDATATELVSGPLEEGQPVIVAHRTAAPGGLRFFGLRLGL
jgi:HlyD family secretion protein